MSDMGEKEKEFGMALYNIERDGCLNGVYTNQFAEGVIFNEIARFNGKHEPGAIVGNYKCAWFERSSNAVEKKDLEITQSDEGLLTFRWRVGGEVRFEGTGYQMNDTQIAVSYHRV